MYVGMMFLSGGIMAYCAEYRQRVLEFWSRPGNSLRKTAEVFGISTNTLSNWKRLQKETGNLEKKSIERPQKKINLEELRQILQQNPDKFQRELAEHFGVARASIYGALKKLGFTRKKKLSCTKKGTSKKEKNMRKKLKIFLQNQ
jgi:transposase